MNSQEISTINFALYIQINLSYKSLLHTSKTFLSGRMFWNRNGSLCLLQKEYLVLEHTVGNLNVPLLWESWNGPIRTLRRVQIFWVYFSVRYLCLCFNKEMDACTSEWLSITYKGVWSILHFSFRRKPERKSLNTFL